MSDSAISMGVTLYGALRRRRQELGVSQQAVADRLRCSREHFNKIEGGLRVATADQLFMWAEFISLKICVQPVTPTQESPATKRTAP